MLVSRFFHEAGFQRAGRQLAPLNAVIPIELGFPIGFLHRPFVRDFLHGGLFDRIKPC